VVTAATVFNAWLQGVQAASTIPDNALEDALAAVKEKEDDLPF